MTPEQRLWQAVLLRMVEDATNPRPPKPHGKRAGVEAKRWIERGGKDFRTACELAGVDGDFLRDAYLSGRLTHESLHPEKKGTSA